jgi:hypothetical protein
LTPLSLEKSGNFFPRCTIEYGSCICRSSTEIVVVVQKTISAVVKVQLDGKVITPKNESYFIRLPKVGENVSCICSKQETKIGKYARVTNFPRALL